MLNGQSPYRSNFTMYNGLPSNHVYYILKDSYGYLWMGTTQGVVRYNGYSFKLYDQSDGLPNSDVWYLFEDKKKRMWLSSISTDFGYIYNGKYKKVYIDDTDARMLPVYITSTNSGIAFSNLSRKVKFNAQLCVENNDTLHMFSVPGFDSGNYYINTRNQVYALSYSRNEIFEIKFGIWGTKIVKCNVVPRNYNYDARETDYMYGKYLLIYDKPILNDPGYYSEYLNTYDLNTGKADTLRLIRDGHEHISLLENIDDVLTIITDKNIYRYDSSLRLLNITPNIKLINDPEAARSIINIMNDPFWGKWVATTTHGAYVEQQQQNKFRSSTIPLSGYSYAGQDADVVNYLWNKAENKLMRIDSNGKVHTQTFHEFLRVQIKAYDHTRSLLLSNTNTYWYDNKTGRIKLFLKRFATNDADKSHIKEGKLNDKYLDAKDVIHENNDFIFCYPNYIIKFSFTSTEADVKYIDESKYKNFLYDSSRKLLFAYNEDKVFIYNTATQQKVYINRRTLDLLHITKVQQLFLDDKNGNIFVKDYDHFFVFNTHTFRSKELFINYNLVNTTFAFRGDMIVAAGKFGVLFSKVVGPCEVSKTMLYRNVKGGLYQRVNDLVPSPKVITINTDNGAYVVPVPGTIKDGSAEPQHQVVLNYLDAQSAINSEDTLNIKQFATSLSFDLINPLGCGTPKYSYKFGSPDSEAHLLNANELTLPKLIPGRYYVLYLYASDDVWRSNPIALHLYVQPYWWQSSFGSKVILASALVVLALIIALAIYITREVEERKNRKQSLQLGLELKAVYAQLNPHFIFNSLNLTLYLISRNKLEDAYTHVLKFSGLLRAYLESCRNRFITIADEAANISNYIQLQQMRFDKMFSYQVVIDPQISSNVILIPSLILQPIVENAINHGLIPKGKGGELFIEFAMLKNKAITITIDDNGVGREQAAKTHAPELKKSGSYGSDLTKELIKLFNKYENAGIEMIYTDKKYPLTGTTVTIVIKNTNYNAR